MKTGAEILNTWLIGTTCRRPAVKRSLLLENDLYVVLKHHSHREYCGRMTGSTTCNVYVKLYLKADFEDVRKAREAEFYGRGSIREWGSRVTLQQIVDDCRALGITFD